MNYSVCIIVQIYTHTHTYTHRPKSAIIPYGHGYSLSDQLKKLYRDTVALSGDQKATKILITSDF